MTSLKVHAAFIGPESEGYWEPRTLRCLAGSICMEEGEALR